MSPINFGAAQLLEALKIFAPEKSEQLDDQLRAYLTGRLKRDDVIAVAQAVVGPEVMREALPTLRAEIATLCDVLGGDVRAVPAEDASMALVPLRNALVSAVDAATELKTERTEARRRRGCF